MPVRDKCDGCHGAKEVAIMAALSRIRLCESAPEILDPGAERLGVALDWLRQVPEDLGEVYELVYDVIRKGGKLPAYGRWIEGKGTHARPTPALACSSCCPRPELCSVTTGSFPDARPW
jgi:hypothetical protein